MTPASPVGFGEYENFVPDNFENYQSAQKTHTLIVSCLTGSAATGLVIVTVCIPAMVYVTPVALIGLAVWEVHTVLRNWAVQNHFPPNLVDGLRPRDFQARSVGEAIQENGQALVLSDAVESKKYKLDLIRHAQSTIFLSCYMGEEAFDEALDLIKERMAQNQDLKVFIFGSEYFLTPENHKRVEFLQTTYPERFFAVLNQEIYYSQHPTSGRSHLLSTNHIKLMAIDQGAYTIIGGCALRPFWTSVKGSEHLARLQATFDIFNPLEAKGFRDMDFVLKSAPGGAGTTSFLEGAKLMLRYAHLRDPAYAQKIKAAFIDVMRRAPVATQVPSMDSRHELAQNIGIKLFSTGPDHVRNSYLRALIDIVNNAREKITIAHMYFHPPQILIDALKEAAKRGVKIEIITNSKEKEAPLAHRFFVDLSESKYQQLFTAEGHENVKVHGFYRANTTYHKKVIVVDDRYTAFGSSNLGKKSLEENPDDYEFNAIADSPRFAAETMRVLQQDIAFSSAVAQEPLSWETWAFALFQETFMTNIL